MSQIRENTSRKSPSSLHAPDPEGGGGGGHGGKDPPQITKL